MNDIDTNRIKMKFYNKLEDENKMKNKRAKLTSVLLVAAVFSLTSISVLAASMGVFDKLFSNFNDVAENVQVVGEQSVSNGVTMTLTGYLADNSGIVPELVFTMDDGSAFPDDVMAVGYDETPDITINKIERQSNPYNTISDDGLSYHCLPIVHYNIEKISSLPLEINVDKLIYNRKESSETVMVDLFGSYQNADVKTYDNIGPASDFEKLFDDTADAPIQTEIGTTIDSVIFAKVKAASDEVSPDAPQADGVDLAGLSANKYDNIIGIKYSYKLEKDGAEYEFSPVGLLNNDDPFGLGLDVDNDTQYYFFRVDDFEDLKGMGGINFEMSSNNAIDGNWHIKTQFAANQTQSTATIEKSFGTENPEATLCLSKADISLLSTRLTYKIKDSAGNPVTDISGYDLNANYLNAITNNEIKLLYDNGEEISLGDLAFSVEDDGTINVSYDVDMTPGNYALMNTSKLSAIVVNGEIFEIN